MPDHRFLRMKMGLTSLRRCRKKSGTSNPESSPVFVEKMLTRRLPLCQANRTTAYRLSLDGFLFWPDNTPCEIPLPHNTRIVGASTPPNYRANDRSIPAGIKFDPIAFVWVAYR